MTNLARKLNASEALIVVESLISQLPEDDNNTVISVKQENIPGSPAHGPHPTPRSSKYDPSTTYILEFCVMLAVRDAETIVTLGKLVFDTLHGVLRDSSQYHPITVSRAAFCALFLLKASYVSQHRAKFPNCC